MLCKYTPTKCLNTLHNTCLMIHIHSNLVAKNTKQQTLQQYTKSLHRVISFDFPFQPEKKSFNCMFRIKCFIFPLYMYYPISYVLVQTVP